MRHNARTLSNLLKIAVVALVAAAIYLEFRKPPDERVWHGKIANLIPYDFRPPTMDRLRQRFWNPEDPRIFTEHIFGVGWVINFYNVHRKLQILRREPPPSDSEDIGEGL